MSDVQIPPVTDRPIRLGVLISGGGTTLLNFLECIEDGSLNAEVALVIASSVDCRGIERAQEAGLNCCVVARRGFGSTATFSERVFELLREAEVDLVTLAGFLSLLEIPPDVPGDVVECGCWSLRFAAKGCMVITCTRLPWRVEFA